MISNKYPETAEEANQITYGRETPWAKASPWNQGKCAVEIFSPPHYLDSHQCKRKSGHGPGDLYCRQHAKEVEAVIAETRDEKPVATARKTDPVRVTISKELAQALIDSIQEYALATGEVAGEGNSGEFSTKETMQEAEARFAAARLKIAEDFYRVTGWKPVYHEAQLCTNGRNSWYGDPFWTIEDAAA